jgi:hypothetical protein
MNGKPAKAILKMRSRSTLISRMPLTFSGIRKEALFRSCTWLRRSMDTCRWSYRNSSPEN